MELQRCRGAEVQRCRGAEMQEQEQQVQYCSDAVVIMQRCRGGAEVQICSVVHDTEVQSDVQSDVQKCCCCCRYGGAEVLKRSRGLEGQVQRGADVQRFRDQKCIAPTRNYGPREEDQLPEVVQKCTGADM